jgi:hypothetical protein
MSEQPLSNCVADRFRQWAQTALDEWDGISTAELIVAILEQTGENLAAVIADAESMMSPAPSSPDEGKLDPDYDYPTYEGK